MVRPLISALALLALAATAPASAAPRDLPPHAPPAARQPEPELPAPRGWPFPESFPRTSGTSRLAKGALLWTDFLYDDHGATGAPGGGSVTALAAPDGTYSYPSGPARGNGADIFRIGIGKRRGASYWRIDWTTLVDHRVPIAVFALDTDDDRETGSASWPAAAGLRSPGAERFLVVSGSGAWLIGPGGERTDVTRGGGRLVVDADARSFVARVPASLLRPRGRWTVRVATGLADADGASLAAAPGALPGQPRVYNLGFRTRADEPPKGNFWMEDAQAAALTAGEDPFGAKLRWRQLGQRRSTPEPLPTGYSNRWYVSSIEPGQGVVSDSFPSGDLAPNFLGRVQPYAVYVPRTFRPRDRNQLVWILHSLSVQHNQYGALNPRFLEAACEHRRRICATTLGRGPDGWYMDEAELDFWEVWNRLAQTYRLDPSRTVISGYSMGGYATYRLGLAYPDAFARALTLAGPPALGIRVIPGVDVPADAVTDRDRSADGDTRPLLANARWIPWYVAHGAVDELVPVTGVLDQVGEMDRLGLRYLFELYPLEDHLLYAAQDGFSAAARQLDRRRAERRPPRFDFRWYPNLVRRDWGLGPRAAYWLSGLRARDPRPGALARVSARSHALPARDVALERASEPILGDGEQAPPATGLESILGVLGAGVGTVPDLLVDLLNDLLVSGDPALGVRVRQAWRAGEPEPRRRLIELELERVKGLTLDARAAGLRRRERFRVLVEADAPVRIRVAALRPGRRLLVDGRRAARADDRGRAAVRVAGGAHELAVR